MEISPNSVIDVNPNFGADQAYATTAARVAEDLWNACGGDVSIIPQYYLDQLSYTYSDGRQSLLPAIDRLTANKDITFEEFSESVAELIQGSYTQSPEDVVEIPVAKLLSEPDLDFTELDVEDFAEGDMGAKVQQFLKKIISSIYTDGVTRVTDQNGQPPSEENNFLMSEDGTEFTGLFFDAVGKKKFPFKISEKGGKWSILY